MEFEMKPHIVYVKADAQGRITAVNSSAFLTDTEGFTAIDEGYGDKYHHAQGNYFPEPIMDNNGVYRYKLKDGKPEERTQEEQSADETPLCSGPTDKERIAALEEQNALLTQCLLEMSERVYA